MDSIWQYAIAAVLVNPFWLVSVGTPLQYIAGLPLHSRKGSGYPMHAVGIKLTMEYISGGGV